MAIGNNLKNIYIFIYFFFAFRTKICRVGLALMKTNSVENEVFVLMIIKRQIKKYIFITTIKATMKGR